MEFKEDPKFSVIVPVYDVPKDVFKRCLMSIADQDYENLEVVIVANGGDKEAFEAAKEFAEGREKWKVIFSEEKGACQARNLGFKESTGDIVSFTNSDYILKVGCIRMWVDALVTNPDCGFVYGAYEYRTASKDVYWSKDFDVFQLEVANYIDCGFPLWRKHVVAWDPEVKSLQDWDFWLRVVKQGVKGHYLGREISFVAEPPRPKGLSHDSTDNWLERVKFIKDKNEIPTRDICVVSFGAPNHGVKIAQMIGADFRDDTLHKPHNYKALYLIGWYMKPGDKDNPHSKVILAFKNRGAKIIVHFVGADIFWLRKFSVQAIREWAGAMKLSCDRILCENELAQKELAYYGIDAQIVPIPPYTDLELSQLPKDFSVALYLSDRSDFDKYLQQYTLSLVKAMPDIQFKGYGDGAKEYKAKNFTHVGNMITDEWAQFVLNTSAYVRLVRHDTRPMATDEFVIAGRSVITNIPSDVVEYVDTSGTYPFDKWDTFSPGFSPIRWPDTKKKLVQAIRRVRDQQRKGGQDYEGERLARSVVTKSLLNKTRYIDTIKELAYEPVLDVVHA